MKRSRDRVSRLQANDKSNILSTGRAIDGAGLGVQLESQMMPRKVIQIVKCVLGQAQEVVGLLGLELVCLDRDAEGEDWATGLEKQPSAHMAWC